MLDINMSEKNASPRPSNKLRLQRMEKFNPSSLASPHFSLEKPDLETPESSEGIEYIWTQDPKLLLEYFDVRRYSYTSYLGLRHFSGNLDEVDVRSHILLAIKDGRCVGGSRLTLRDMLTDASLPMESDDFRLVDKLPELDLKNKMYCEYSRVAFLDEYRDGRHVDQFYTLVLEKCVQLDVRYIFAVAPLPQARRSRRAGEKLGLHAVTRTDITVPDLPVYEGIRMYLSYFEVPRGQK